MPRKTLLPRFAADELERFLLALDGELTHRTFVILIGGGAAALGYGVSAVTKDLDTLTDVADIDSAIRRARRETGLDIPMEPTPVADLPYEFESRLVRVMPHLKRLELFVPEAHDLVLSKLGRAHAGDLAAIEELHRRHPLSFDTLVTRYLEEMTHAIGDPQRLNGNFLLGIDVLFGEIKREDARRALDQRQR